jgi:hypothetical protein
VLFWLLFWLASFYVPGAMFGSYFELFQLSRQ